MHAMIIAEIEKFPRKIVMLTARSISIECAIVPTKPMTENVDENNQNQNNWESSHWKTPPFYVGILWDFLLLRLNPWLLLIYNVNISQNIKVPNCSKIYFLRYSWSLQKDGKKPKSLQLKSRIEIFINPQSHKILFGISR